MNEPIILFGAGACGRYALKFLREKGIEPIGFADNDEQKWFSVIDGVPVLPVEKAVDSSSANAIWVACAISRPAATEIRSQLKTMGVNTKPLWEYIPVCHGLPPANIRDTLFPAMGDVESQLLFNDQVSFRRNPDYDYQMNPSPISELYFPNFITHREDEVFIDCGAADGDTVRDFIGRWPKFKSIVAFEPDARNYSKLIRDGDPAGKGRITSLRMAVSDFDGDIEFAANGDYSSHLSAVESRDASGGETVKVRATYLDKMLDNIIPTYVKMDIEGSELEALWGARKIIKKHKPVLAICAYHTSDHLWEIPMLIHAINPDYKLFFRRYGEGAFETVWYGVSPDRVHDFKLTSATSYSDNHVG